MARRVPGVGRMAPRSARWITRAASPQTRRHYSSAMVYSITIPDMLVSPVVIRASLV